MQTNESEQRSMARSRRVRDFFYHLAVYVFMLVLLYAVAGVNGALFWLLLVWGFAVVLHGIYAYFG